MGQLRKERKRGNCKKSSLLLSSFATLLLHPSVPSPPPPHLLRSTVGDTEFRVYLRYFFTREVWDMELFPLTDEAMQKRLHLFFQPPDCSFPHLVP